MSLQVWLPLNGHIKNYGLSNASIFLVNNPTTIISNRGKVYDLNPNNENNQAIELNIPDMPEWVKSEFSIAFWVYHRETSDRSIFFGSYDFSDNYIFNIEKLAITNGLRIYMEAAPDLQLSNCIIPENEWVHIVITKSLTELKVYKNGELLYTRTHASSDLWNKSDSVKYHIGRDGRNDTTALNGMISDFRIYNHILSKKEINELAQGLILNYSFNNPYIDNLTVDDVSGYGNHGNIFGANHLSNDAYRGNYSLQLEGVNNSYSERSYVLAPLQLSNVKTYTFAAFIKINTWGTQTSGIWCADLDGNIPISYKNSLCHHRDGYFDITTQENTSSDVSSTHKKLLCDASDLIPGQWTHIAITYDGQTASLYKNGIFIRSTSFDNITILAPCNYIFLSYSCAGEAHRVTKANWSDFRVYTTALDAAAIKKLSERRVAVDKNNNFYAYSLLEDSTARYNIDKAGNLTAKELQEINKAAIYKNYFEANNFYEN